MKHEQWVRITAKLARIEALLEKTSLDKAARQEADALLGELKAMLRVVAVAEGWEQP